MLERAIDRDRTNQDKGQKQQLMMNGMSVTSRPYLAMRFVFLRWGGQRTSRARTVRIHLPAQASVSLSVNSVSGILAPRKHLQRLFTASRSSALRLISCADPSNACRKSHTSIVPRRLTSCLLDTQQILPRLSARPNAPLLLQEAAGLALTSISNRSE